MHWRRKWQPTPVFLPGESQGRGSLMPAVYGVAQSRTRLKRLSSSSSLHYCSKDHVQPSTGPWFEFKVSSKHNYMVFRKVFYQYPSTLWVSCIPLLASISRGLPLKTTANLEQTVTWGHSSGAPQGFETPHREPA